jgi:TatA/E family protein of Tat protein translocase
MFGIGPTELLVVMILALLLFGPKKMPEIGKSLGAALRELRRTSNEFMSVIDGVGDEPERPVRSIAAVVEEHEEHFDESWASGQDVERHEELHDAEVASDTMTVDHETPEQSHEAAHKKEGE